MALLTRLQLLSLPRTPTLLLNRMKYKSSAKLQDEFKNIRASAILQSAACQDILSRARVVTESEESQAVVEGLMSAGTPVGLDMEGVNNSKRTSLIQISDVAGNITLFRTGVNPDLYSRGGLADLLQSPTVLKVLHAGSVDCLSIYKDGVKMWNIFDTSVAYKVLDFQKSGTNLYSAESISFNKLCSYYGLPENPLKDVFKNILWKMELTRDGEFGLDSPSPMQDEFIVYCAWDVLPLLSLHDFLQREISPCYHHLVNQMSEIEILRAIDPGLAKSKRKNLKSMSELSLFLSDLPPATSPPDLYLSLAGQTSGHKHVQLSQISGTASVLLDNREMVVKAVREFQSWATPEMKEHNTQCKLVVESFENETFGMGGVEEKEEGENEKDIHSAQNKTSVNLDTVSQCRDLVSALVASKSPVVMDFSLFKHEGEERTGVELYMGAMPSYKLMMTQELLTEGGLASLFSGNTVKIVNRLDSDAVASGLSYLGRNGVSVRNVFDLSMAARSLDFFKYGQSWFQQPMPSSKNIGKFLGLSISPKTSRQHQAYLAYLHLNSEIPPNIQSLLNTFAELDIGIATLTNESLKAKAKKNDLKRDLETKCVHIRLTGKSINKQSREKLENLVSMFSKDASNKTFNEEQTGIIRDYQNFGRAALVQLSNNERVGQLIEYLERRMDDSDLNYKVTDTSYKKILEKPKTVTNMDKLDALLRENLENLSNSGLQISYIEDSNISLIM